MKILVLKDKKAIQEGLVSFNRSVLGDQSFGEFTYVALKDGHFVGGLSGGYGWNYAGIDKLTYDQPETLKILLNAVFKDYGHLHGLDIGTSNSEIKGVFKDLGFESNLQLKDMPKGKTFEYLIRYKMTSYDIDNPLTVVTDDQYKDRIQKDNIFETSPSQEVIYGAFEGDQLVGGLVGLYKNDYLYIDILWVQESARKKGIGSALMTHIESKAYEKGIRNIWLGTASFQARGLYEKLGYHVEATFEQCPKGYDNYTMLKVL